MPPDPTNGIDSTMTETQRAWLLKNPRKIPLVIAGRAFGLLGNLFTEIPVIITLGMESTGQPVPPIYVKDSSNAHSLYLQLMRTGAGFVEKELRKRGAEGVVEIADAIHRGRKFDRGNIISNVNKNIQYFYDFKTSLPADKSKRGWQHSDCLDLLAPATVDIADPIVREKLVNRDGGIPTTAEHYPCLLWADAKPDRANLDLGFLESKLLARVLIMMLFGPKAGIRGTHAIEDGKKPGRAKLYGINAITPPLLAYAATVARFSLSDQLQFSSTVVFNYRRFYERLLEFMYLELEDDERSALMAWYFDQVFGGELLWGGSEPDKRTDPSAPKSADQLIRERRAARREARRAAANAAPVPE